MNPEILSFQYARGMCLLLENVGGSEQNRSVANVQSDDLWPSRMHAATHILCDFYLVITASARPLRCVYVAIFAMVFMEEDKIAIKFLRENKN